jgi:uncharacterized oxidoreductase
MIFENGTVLITGGATGIGFAMAEYLAEKGNKVIICGRRSEKLEQAKARLPELHTVVCDVARAKDREILVSYVEENHPDMNLLINNAGIQREIDLTKGIEEIGKGEAEIDINLKAPIYLSAMFTPLLAHKKNAAILNVSSGLGFASDRFPDMPVYSAVKAGIHAFSKAQRVQLRPLGIRVMEIIPPMVDTDLNPAHAAKLKSQDPERFSNPDIVPPPDVYVRRTFEKLASGDDEVKY